MSLPETLELSLKVLEDWRVIAIAVAVLLLWAALRYVGSVYRKRSPTRPRPSAPRAVKAAPAKRQAAASEPDEGDLVD
jgi:hypothetical protein